MSLPRKATLLEGVPPECSDDDRANTHTLANFKRGGTVTQPIKSGPLASVSRWGLLQELLE